MSEGHGISFENKKYILKIIISDFFAWIQTA